MSFSSLCTRLKCLLRLLSPLPFHHNHLDACAVPSDFFLQTIPFLPALLGKDTLPVPRPSVPLSTEEQSSSTQRGMSSWMCHGSTKQPGSRKNLHGTAFFPLCRGRTSAGLLVASSILFPGSELEALMEIFCCGKCLAPHSVPCSSWASPGVARLPGEPRHSPRCQVR